MGRNLEKDPPDSVDLQEYKEQCEVSVNQMLHTWALRLKACGVVKVVCRYAGGGDDGSIDGYEFFKRQRKRGGGTELVAFEPEIPGRIVKTENRYNKGHFFDQDLLDKVFYDLLEVRGWEVNNAGSQGDFTWDIEADTFVHEHGSNFYDTEGWDDAKTNPEHDPDSDEYEGQKIDTEYNTILGVDDMKGRWHV